MRDSAFGPIAIPPEFWSRPDVISALTARDIGQLFRLIQQWTGVSQTRIGVATGNAQGRVSAIINGKYQVKTISSLTRIADGLAMPRSSRTALGLAPGADDGTSVPLARPIPSAPALPVPDPQYPASIGQAITLSTGLWHADSASSPEALSAPLDPAAWNGAALTWLLSQPDSSLPGNSQGRAVGRSDVARVRDSSVLVADLDNRFGGAHARRMAVHFLHHDAATLLTGRYTDGTGRELFAAVAEATLLAGWTSYDCGLHGLAQRYFIQALRLAQAAGDHRLGCSILSAMSHQATYLGHLTEAANLARGAHGGLHGLATPALTAQFHAMEARALARAGDTTGCHAALAAAERAFQIPRPGHDPDFIGYFNEAELAAEMAHCFRDLGDPHRAARHAALATPSDGQYTRSDFFVTMVKAHALADQGDADQACAVALDALDLGEALTSARCVAYVREFRDRLARFGDTSAIRDFTERATGHTLWVKAA